MNDFITSHDEWYKEYQGDREKTWVVTEFSDNSKVYFSEHKDWLKIKALCKEKRLSITKLQLQFRSNVVDIEIGGVDAIYLIRSVKGLLGGDSKNYLTVGKVQSNNVKKDMWLIPELIIEETFEETIDNCFEEAIIYQYGKEKIQHE